MKTLTALAAASILLISATAANASYFGTTVKDTIMTDTATTRAAAYQAGADKLSSLKSSSPRQLSNELSLFSPDIIERSVKLDSDGYVTVQERLGADGKVGYVGVVNVDVNYETHENDN